MSGKEEPQRKRSSNNRHVTGTTHGLKPIYGLVTALRDKATTRKFVSLGRILKYWPDIMGEDMAGKTLPIKIHYRKAKKGKNPAALLEIGCASADATVLHYRKDLILARMNQVFGNEWITEIKFIHLSLPQPEKPQNPGKNPLTPTQKNTLSLMLENVQDEELKAQLRSLGTEIIRKEHEKQGS